MNGLLRSTVLIVASSGLAACQTAGNQGGSLLDGVFPTAENTPTQQEQQVAAAPTGQNPNARTKLRNTRNALSDYCPAVRIRAGTEAFRDYKGQDENNDDNVAYQATINQVARECAYVGNNLEIKVGARGRVITGPAGGPGTLTMPIRVAVTRGNETVYSKLHRPQSTVPEGSANTEFSFVDENVVIPAPTATNVRVYVGFDEGPYNTP
ncbi:MAG: hypothetical protein OXR62_13515 [Ahrensia sp.]|nr:hypothetical protein [Ahrensia sp.]